MVSSLAAPSTLVPGGSTSGKSSWRVERDLRPCSPQHTKGSFPLSSTYGKRGLKTGPLLLMTGKGEHPLGMCVEEGVLFLVVGTFYLKFTSPTPIPAPSGYLGTPPTCSLICPAASVGGSGPGPTRHCSLSILSMSGPRLSQEVTYYLFVCLWGIETPPINTAAELLTPELVTYTLMLTPRISLFLPGIVAAKSQNQMIPGTRDPQTR